MKTPVPVAWLWFWLLALTALRLWMLPQIELSPDEAYYFMWSERLDWAYDGKGPGVAAAIWAGTQLFGPTEFGVRFWSPILSLGTSWFVWLLACRVCNRQVGFWTVVVLNLLPIFNVGSLLMTIDPLSLFFWSAGLYTFWRAVQEEPRFSWWWPLTGLALACGFLAKYTNLFALLGMVLFLFLTPELRRTFLRPGFWTMLLAFLPGLIPPFLWNRANDWVTLGQLRERAGIGGGMAFRPLDFLEYLGVHFGVYSPLFFLLLLASLGCGWARARTDRGFRLLLCFGLPIFMFYFALALNRSGEANGTAPGMISLGILTVATWLPRVEAGGWTRPFAVATLVVAMAMSALIVNTEPLRIAGVPWPYPKDPSGQLRAWSTTARGVQEVMDAVEQRIGVPVFLITNQYQTAAELDFYLPDQAPYFPGYPQAFIPESQAIQNQFSFWNRYDGFIEVSVDEREALGLYNPSFTEQDGINPFMQCSALYLTDYPEEIPVISPITNAFVSTEWLGELRVTRRGMPVRTFRVFLCHSYETLPL